MPETGRYCKAYLIERFREYENWSAFAKTADEPVDGEETEEQPFLYLQENYVVTKGIFKDEDVVFDRVTEDWIAFCREKLQFQIPDFGDDESDEAAGETEGGST